MQKNKNKNIAREKNEVHYQSDTACQYCTHLIRYVSNGGCVPCTKKRATLAQASNSGLHQKAYYYKNRKVKKPRKFA